MATLTAGERSERVTLQSVTNVPDGYGGQTSTWAPVPGASGGQFWAKVEQVPSDEVVQAGQTLSRRIYEVSILKRALEGVTVTSAMRFQWRSKVLSVGDVIEAHPDRSRTVFRCTEEATA